MAKDLVCGMEVNEKDTEYMVHIEHMTYYFCSEMCKKSFEEKMGLPIPEKKKGGLMRFLCWVAGGAARRSGGKPPKGH